MKPQNHTGVQQPQIMKYAVRTGTINSGKKFEHKMAALLTLRCALTDQGDMWIASNAPDVGAFDDIVLSHGGSTFLLQLKHQDIAKNIKLEELVATRGDFALSKYLKDIAALNRSLGTTRLSEFHGNLGKFSNMNFVLFTNRNVNECEFLERTCNSTLSVLKTKTKARMYKINTTKLPDYVNAFDADIYSKVYLLTNQISAKQADELIAKELMKFAQHLTLTRADVQDVAERFAQYVTDWAEGNLGLGYHYCLTKAEILQKLTELLLTKYEINLSGTPFTYHRYKRRLLWNQVVKTKSVTLVQSSKNVLQFLSEYVGSEVRKYCASETNFLWSSNLPVQFQKIVFREHAHLQLSLLKIVKNSTNVTFMDAYRCLCMAAELPFLLQITRAEHYNDVLQILKLSKYYYKVIIAYETEEPLSVVDTGTITHFFTLQDLNEDDKSALLQLSVKLQGRPNAILGDIVDDSMFQYISCRDIINILLNNFNIGNQLEPLVDHFIERSVSKVFLGVKVLNLVKDEVFAIEGDTEKLESVMENPNVYKIKDFDFVFDQTHKTVHHLKIYDSNYLEWKTSYGSPKKVRRFQVNIDNELESNILNKLGSKVTILSAWPGMGKTVAMDYLAHRAPTDAWVLKIDLNAHQKYYRSDKGRSTTTEALEHLTYFNQHKNNTDLADAVFRKFLDTKRVVILLDGFDEVSVSYKSEVMNIAKSLYQEGYSMWVTTRPHAKTHLEEEFDTFSVNLQPFTKNDQTQFLRKYFGSRGATSGSDNLVIKFVGKLLQAASKQLDDKDARFTGIPLQSKLLADVFMDDCRKFVSSRGKTNFTKNFNLVYLYKRFINRKIDILCDRFGESSRDLVVMFKEHQQLFALKILFPLYDDVVAHIDRQLDYYTNQPHRLELLQKTGIVIVDENFNVAFTHRTFTEYSAAKWLVKSINSQEEKLRSISKSLSENRFSGNYNFLFRLLDLIAAKKCPLHAAIINKQIEETMKIINSGCDSVNSVDKIGRSVLHITALYGIQYPLLFDKVGQSFTCYEGKMFLRSNVFNSDPMLPILEKLPGDVCLDELGHSPLDYALANFSLTIANQIHTKLQISIVRANIDLKFKQDYLGYCALLNYRSLFDTLLLYFASKDLLLNNVKSDQLVESYLQNMFPDLFVKSELHGFLSHQPQQKKTILELLQSSQGDAYTGRSGSYYSDLRYAIALGSKSNVNTLLSDTTDINKYHPDGNTLLHYSVLHGKLEIIGTLLSKGAKINKQNVDNNASLHLAVSHSLYGTATKLIENDADINIENGDRNTPLHLALLNSDTSMATLLLSHNADVNIGNACGDNVLHLAANLGCNEIVKKIIPKGGCVNKQNMNGETPLFHAVRENKISTVNMLTHFGADVNIQNKAGETILHVAAYGRCDDMVKAIMLNNIDINKQDNCGNTPLFYAVEKNNVNIVKLLISSGADVNIQYNMGQTVLHLAVYWDYFDTVKEIISKGRVDINKQDCNGQTALFGALARNNASIKNLLTSAGAQ